MPEIREGIVRQRERAQATELSRLVELEARWENMRRTPARAQETASTTQTLLGVQKAYDAFRSQLVAYNKRYTPAHVPELLLNTPSRLALWCRRMRDLYLELEDEPQIHCPVHLLEKAYRSAERLSARLNTSFLARVAPPATIRAATETLMTLVQWCEALGNSAATA
jgi:hypothetical protein